MFVTRWVGMEITDFKDIHKGERGFVIGNGPSLNDIDLDRLKDEITFGGNLIFLHKNFSPMYYSIEDWRAIDVYYRRINRYKKPKYKFIAYRYASDFIRGDDVVYIDFDRSVRGTNIIDKPCDKDDNKFYWMSTITNLLIQLAYYMGCNPIYLIGVDHLLKDSVKQLSHFSEEYNKYNNKPNLTYVKLLEEGYRLNKEFLEKEGYHIYNLNPDSYLEIYEKKRIDEII